MCQNRSAAVWSPDCQSLSFWKKVQDLAASGEGHFVNRETTNLRNRLSHFILSVCYHCCFPGRDTSRHGTCFSHPQQHDTACLRKTPPTSILQPEGRGYNEATGSTATAGLTQVDRTLSATHGNAHVSCEGSRNPIRTARRKDFLLVNVELSLRGVRKDG